MVKTVAERNTRQKQAIRAAFERTDRPLSTDEVYREAERESRGLGMATVYRSLRTLVDEGWLSIVEVPGRNALYERSGKGHHHHFSCETCDRVYELDECASVEAALPRGFRAKSHEVTFYGVCADCSAAARKKAVPRKSR